MATSKAAKDETATEEREAHPLTHAAVAAHQWYGKLMKLAQEAQADIERFIPADVIREIERSSTEDAAKAVEQRL